MIQGVSERVSEHRRGAAGLTVVCDGCGWRSPDQHDTEGGRRATLQALTGHYDAVHLAEKRSEVFGAVGRLDLHILDGGHVLTFSGIEDGLLIWRNPSFCQWPECPHPEFVLTMPATTDEAVAAVSMKDAICYAQMALMKHLDEVHHLGGFGK